MVLQEILDLYPLMDRPGRVAEDVAKLFRQEHAEVEVTEVRGERGLTDFIKIVIPGKNGKADGGNKPTFGIVGRLGGIGARPTQIGFVSDGDGALSALAAALRLARMRNAGDVLEGDVIVATHLCTSAPTVPHEPVPFMGSPVDLDVMNKQEVDERMDALVSIDTSLGNKIIKNNNFAITPTVKEGWILKVSDDLVRLMEYVTGGVAAVVPITMQDITPYSNGVYHFNSLMLPATATKAPVVGIAVTSTLPVPGCATGVTRFVSIDEIGRYVIEVAKAFTNESISFYDQPEYEKLCSLYGDMSRLQQ